uniref:BZIP domain-containing protein n=1 Tax=Meloidogyne hapla TaxID=6305 RepID=A0A1I8BQ44_MELHA
MDSIVDNFDNSSETEFVDCNNMDITHNGFDSILNGLDPNLGMLADNDLEQFLGSSVSSPLNFDLDDLYGRVEEEQNWQQKYTSHDHCYYEMPSFCGSPDSGLSSNVTSNESSICTSIGNSCGYETDSTLTLNPNLDVPVDLQIKENSKPAFYVDTDGTLMEYQEYQTETINNQSNNIIENTDQKNSLNSYKMKQNKFKQEDQTILNSYTNGRRYRQNQRRNGMLSSEISSPNNQNNEEYCDKNEDEFENEYLDATSEVKPVVMSKRGRYQGLVLTEEERKLCKKVYIEALEQRIENCTKENGELKRQIEILAGENRHLVTQLRNMQMTLGNTTKLTGQRGTCLAVLLLSVCLIVAPNGKQFGMTGVRNTNNQQQEMLVEKFNQKPGDLHHSDVDINRGGVLTNLDQTIGHHKGQRLYGASRTLIDFVAPEQKCMDDQISESFGFTQADSVASFKAVAEMKKMQKIHKNLQKRAQKRSRHTNYNNNQNIGFNDTNCFNKNFDENVNCLKNSKHGTFINGHYSSKELYPFDGYANPDIMIEEYEPQLDYLAKQNDGGHILMEDDDFIFTPYAMSGGQMEFIENVWEGKKINSEKVSECFENNGNKSTIEIIHSSPYQQI